MRVEKHELGAPQRGGVKRGRRSAIGGVGKKVMVKQSGSGWWSVKRITGRSDSVGRKKKSTVASNRQELGKMRMWYMQQRAAGATAPKLPPRHQIKTEEIQ